MKACFYGVLTIYLFACMIIGVTEISESFTCNEHMWCKGIGSMAKGYDDPCWTMHELLYQREGVLK